MVFLYRAWLIIFISSVSSISNSQTNRTIEELLDFSAPVSSWTENKNYPATKATKKQKEYICDYSLEVSEFMYCLAEDRRLVHRGTYSKKTIDKRSQNRVIEHMHDFLPILHRLIKNSRIAINNKSIIKMTNIHIECESKTKTSSSEYCLPVRYWLYKAAPQFANEAYEELLGNHELSFTHQHELFIALLEFAPKKAQSLEAKWLAGNSRHLQNLIILSKFMQTSDRDLAQKLVEYTLEYSESDKEINSSKHEAENNKAMVKFIAKHLLLSSALDVNAYFRALIQAYDYSNISRFASYRANFFVPILLEYVDSKDADVRKKIINALAEFYNHEYRKDILLALLPWLSQPDWAEQENGYVRLRVVQALDEVYIPEAIPGLLWVIKNDPEDSLVAYSANSLLFYKDEIKDTNYQKQLTDAVSAAINRMTKSNYRRDLVRVALKLSVYRGYELVSAMQSFRNYMSTEDGRKRYEESFMFGKSVLPVDVLLGSLIESIDSESVKASFLTELMNTRSLSNKDLLMLSDWRHPIINRQIVTRIESGKANAELINRVLSFRQTLDFESRRQLSKIASQKNSAAGIAKVLLDNDEDLNDYIAERNENVAIGILACARLLRISLKIDAIANLQYSSNALLAMAAKRYLESEDSRRARVLRQQAEPSDILILGSRMSFDPGHSTYNLLDKWGKKIVSIYQQEDVSEVIALLSAGHWGDAGQIVISKSKQHNSQAKITLHKNNGKILSRDLSDAELNTISDFIIVNNVDDLPAYTPYIHDGMQYEYIHVKNGMARRVFMNNPGFKSYVAQSKGPDVYAKLVDRFFKLEKSGEYSTDYKAREKRPDIKILGLDLKPSIWTQFENEFSINNNTCGDEKSSWQAQTTRGYLYKDNSSYYFCIDGNKQRILNDGNYSRGPVITPDGRWLVTAKTDKHWAIPNYLVKVDLSTMLEEVLPFEKADILDPIVWLEEHQSILVIRAKDRDPSYSDESKGPKEPEYSLLDPHSNQVTQIDGDFDYLNAHYLQPLAPSKLEHVKWMSRPRYFENYTQFGKYDLRTFEFKSLITIEDIVVSNHEFWVDIDETFLFIETDSNILKVPISQD